MYNSKLFCLSHRVRERTLPNFTHFTSHVTIVSMQNYVSNTTSKYASEYTDEKMRKDYRTNNINDKRSKITEPKKETISEIFSRQRRRESKEDKLLEEEEKNELRKADETCECLPLWRRWARNAELYDKELTRLRFVLFAKPQFIADNQSGSTFCKAASLSWVIDKLVLVNKSETSQVTSTKEEASASINESDNEVERKNYVSSADRIKLITLPQFTKYVQWKGSSSQIIRCVNYLGQCLSEILPKTSNKTSYSKAKLNEWPTSSLEDNNSYSRVNIKEKIIDVSSVQAERHEEYYRQEKQETHEQWEEYTSAKDLVTLTADIDYIRRVKAMHALKYYHRIYLIPKRHIGQAFFHAFWNVVNGVRNASFAFVWNLLRGVDEKGVAFGTLYGLHHGVTVALQFLFYGLIVSPLIHIPCGLCNTIYCPLNALMGKYFFDGISGRWMRCYAVSKREHMSRLFASELQREKRLICAIGRSECNRKQLRWKSQIDKHLASLGFSLNMHETGNNTSNTTNSNSATSSKESTFGDRFTIKEIVNKFKRYSSRPSSMHNKEEEENNKDNNSHNKKRERSNSARGADVTDTNHQDPYRILNVKTHASREEIRTQFKKLAMKYHPDVVESSQPGQQLTPEERTRAEKTFKDMTAAYQILSNPEKRAAYDRAGARGFEMYNSIHNNAMNMSPEQVMQAIFGGEIFRRFLIGELLRSHWELRIESGICVSLHELEELQCIRMRQLSSELARIVDVHVHEITERMNSTNKEDKINSFDANRAVHDNMKISNRVYIAKAKNNGDELYSLQPHTIAENDFSSEFEIRCVKFVNHLSKASFGKELMYELGIAYVTNAQRFLHVQPFYKPKLLVVRKVFGGTRRLWNETWSNMNMSRHEMLEKVMNEFLSLEFNSIIFDLHATLRHAIQLVLQDETLTEFERRCRCYALWRLGEEMINQGTKWDPNGKMNYTEIIARVHEATASATSQETSSIKNNNVPEFES